MTEEKGSKIDKEGLILSVGAIMTGIFLYTCFELVLNKGKISKTAIYRIPVDVTAFVGNKIAEMELFPSKKDKICDSINKRIEASYDKKVKYINEENPAVTSLVSYLSVSAVDDAMTIADSEASDCDIYGTRRSQERALSSIERFEETIKEKYPTTNDLMKFLGTNF